MFVFTHFVKRANSHRTIFDSYKKYRLLYPDLESKLSIQELEWLANLPVINKVDQLTHGDTYLYVLSAKGELSFISERYRMEEEVTHEVLLKSIDAYYHNNKKASVFSAGEIMIWEDSCYLSLASGHFEPDLDAYHPIVEKLVQQNIPQKWVINIQCAYEKSLDPRISSIALSAEHVARVVHFKQALLKVLNDVSIKLESPVKRFLTSIIDEFSGKDGAIQTGHLKIIFNKLLKHPEILHTLCQYKDLLAPEIQQKIDDYASSALPIPENQSSHTSSGQSHTLNC